ncbi:biopolymer transporter ExbD [Aquabacterium sp.]|uniref:ExbD/TolR family protein n=1 Tax=Aquabacterium sp. TaxID=1872578 RepID=UPI0011D4E85F|nr:biopolymer transporter ExbD [Aquabacterium sp.]MBP6612672.1 biopolymer transporter ExbD [Aquabacterium sp.]MBP6615455.1 biopolymer transporter ExbD [Aquabacterium sp.]MBP7502678.1 biopolymer transporter ExbD [Aquabacterium sp.]MCC6218196.1 biopolymer transporter ExbD [Aquabacterium sp.]MDD2975424.1 biopolymer transporter ExbD [Aquabacterium sp.]
MNFRRRRPPEDPEINLIPFIDVLLVILIFLMLTTTYSKVSELKINLPTANAQASKSRPAEVVVLVAADGRYMVNQRMLAGRGIETLAASLAQVAGNAKDTVVIINADAQASHQSVINVMDAARRVGLTQLTFATQGQHDGAASSGP